MSELKRLKLPPYKITLKDHRASNTKQYRLSDNHAREADRQISELVANKLVEPASLEGAVSYNTPLILVPKRDGTARLVADFRRINSLILPLQVALSRIYDLVQQIASADPVYLTSIYLKSGYWQVPIDEKKSRYFDIRLSVNRKQIPLVRCTFWHDKQRKLFLSQP